MIAVTWRHIRRYIERPTRTILILAAIAFTGGALEAIVLVTIVNVAVGLTSPNDTASVAMPIVGGSLATSTLLVTSMVFAAALFGLHNVFARLTARSSGEVLAAVRQRAITAYFNATWPRQTAERDGALQETVSTLAVQSATLAVSLSTWASAVLNLVALVVAAVVVDPVVMAGLLVVGGCLYAVTRPLARLTVRRATEFVGSNSKFSEAIARFTSMSIEIRTFGVEPRVESELEDLNRAVAGMQTRTRRAGLLGVMLYRDVALLVLVVAVSVMYAVGGGDRLAAAGAVVLLVVRALSYATLLQNITQALNEAGPNLLALDERLLSLEASAPVDGSESFPAGASLRLRAVSYQYDGHDVLTNVDLEIGPGDAVGIVGTSGGGKSTLLQLLLRLREPASGEITVNERSYVEFSRATLNAAIAFVPQDSHLLQASIEDNIRFFRPGIARRDVEAAADAAQVGDEIRRLPQGFETMLGPRGSGLSGGQRQRVSIARALAGHPSVLILDEPTSALDHLSEIRLQETIRALRGEMTLVIVTHRTTTLAACDRTFRMEDGSLQPMGESDVDEMIASQHES